MSTFRSDFLNILTERGFVHQISDPKGLDAALADGVVSAYIGFDCTAPSLHAGSLVQIMMLYWLQQTGHRPVCLMGGGTSLVGDPSGRDTGRQMLTPQDIDRNKAGIRKVFAKVLTFGEGATAAIMPDNAEWLGELNYLDLLRRAGRHISVNEMIKRESVRLRLEREQHLSFLEFNYMVLQAYDFVELHHRYGVTLQMGGSDQWGNIVSGIDLGRKMANVALQGLTTPLLTTSAGVKMGKTADGAVWLNEDMLSPYLFWQYWRDCEDADVGRFLRLFTTLPLDEIRRLEQLQGAERNEAKKILATAVTTLLHGAAAAEAAAETARRTFEEGGAAGDLPTVAIAASELDNGLGVLAAFVSAGLVASNGEARRQIRGGAVRVNDVVCTDERCRLGRGDVTADGVIKLSLGKKRHVLLRPS